METYVSIFVVGLLTLNSLESFLMNDDSLNRNELCGNIRRLPDVSEMMKETALFQANFKPRHSDWMSALSANMSSNPLQGVVIPGSHDTMTYDLGLSSDLSPGSDDKIREVITTICKSCPSLCKSVDKVIYRWAVCQRLNVVQQLDAGIRYFDLRIAARKRYNDTLYFSHMLYTEHTVKDVLNKIRDWSVSHPREVLLLDMNHFYGLSKAHHKTFITEIVSIFGKDRLVKRRKWKDLTLDTLWKNKESVMIFYHDDNIPGQYKDALWDGNTIKSPWLQTSKLKLGLEYLSGNYSLGHNLADFFYVTQGVLTPDASYILLHLSKSLESTLSKEMTRAMSSWVKDKHGGTNGLNIVIANSVSQFSFIDNLLALNGL